MSRQALGRGLSALLGEEGRNSYKNEFLELDIDLIKPNSEQPRKNFPESDLAELSQSIRANGIIQPIIVRRKGKNYQIVAGERRWRAAQRAELEKIPAIVREIEDEKLLELALIENIQRQELNPIEEALAYKKLIEKVGLTQEMVANQVGKTRTFITNYLRLLKLPKEILKFVEEEKLSVGHARALIPVEDHKTQIQLAEQIINKSLSVRETEKVIKRILTGSGVNIAKEKVTAKPDANIKAAESKLRRYLSTQVKIIPTGEGKKGKIEIEFYDQKDLDRIYRLILNHSK